MNETSFPPVGDGRYAAITPCSVCGSYYLMLDDTPFCAECGEDE